MSSSKSILPEESLEDESITLQELPKSSLVPYLSDTGDDSESSDSIKILQEYLADSNHSNYSEVNKKSNSKDCTLASSSDTINNPYFGLNSLKKESELQSHECKKEESELQSSECKKEESQFQSSEYKQNETSASPLKEIPRNIDGNTLKASSPPTSVRNTKMSANSFATPKKRSFSSIENDDDEPTSSFTSKTSIERIQENLKSWESPNQYQTFSRKSLPAKVESEHQTYNKYTCDRQVDNRRKSFPFSQSSYHSPITKRNSYNYRTDQTPYSPAQNAIHQQKRRRFNLPYYDAFSLMSLESESGFIDSHCHLDFIFQRQNYEGTFTDYKKEHEDTFPKSYRGCLAIFCNPFTFSKKDMWEKFLEEDSVWASFGCHPHNAKDYNDYIEKSLYAALEHPKVRALGEIGLDYSNRNNCVKTTQFDVFRRQLKIALEKKLPVVIHCREAHEDAMGIIKEILPINYVIHLHCFTDTWEWAQKWLKEFPNLCIGITNVVTFPSAESVHEVAKNIPLDRLLLETDSPYFIPKRGCQGMRWSHPGLAIHVAAQIAALKEVPIEQVFQATRNNTKRVYSI